MHVIRNLASHNTCTFKADCKFKLSLILNFTSTYNILFDYLLDLLCSKSQDGTMTELLEIITSGALDQDSGVICGCSKVTVTFPYKNLRTIFQSKATKICSKSRKTQKQMFENDAISQNLADLPDLPVGKEKTVIYYWNDFNGDEAV